MSRDKKALSSDERQLDPESAIPLYYQLKEILSERVESGEWLPNSLIPSENDFVAEYSVSRNTVIKAIDCLVRDGILKRRQGKGTFVAEAKFEQCLSSFYTFSKAMEKSGLRAEVRVMALSERRAVRTVAKSLDILVDSPVSVLKRVRYADGEPLMLETSYIPAELAPGLIRHEFDNSSLYDVLFQDYKIRVTKAREVFEPIIIDEYEGELLNVPPGSPGLLLLRTATTAEGTPVEFCKSVLRGDRCRFYTELL